MFEFSGVGKKLNPQLFDQLPSNSLSDTPLLAFQVLAVATDPQLFKNLNTAVHLSSEISVRLIYALSVTVCIAYPSCTCSLLPDTSTFLHMV